MRVCDRSMSPSTLSSHQVRGSIYHAYNFQLTLPSYRIDRLLDPTTSYLCLSNKPKQPCPPHPSKPLFGHVPCLLNHFLVCMLGCYQMLPPVTPWFGLSHYYIFVDDMIIIMLTILDEG